MIEVGPTVLPNGRLKVTRAGKHDVETLSLGSASTGRPNFSGGTGVDWTRICTEDCDLNSRYVMRRRR